MRRQHAPNLGYVFWPVNNRPSLGAYLNGKIEKLHAFEAIFRAALLRKQPYKKTKCLAENYGVRALSLVSRSL